MSWLRVLVSRIRGLFSKRRLERELDDELRAHIDMVTEENVRKGMSAEEARYAARRAFGGVEQTKEVYRTRRGLPIIETLLQDLRFAIRILYKDPGFTVSAVLALALGIGVNTVMFTAYDSIALRLLPVNDAGRLARLSRYFEDGSKGIVFSYPEYVYCRDHNRAFSGLVAGAYGTRLILGAESSAPEMILGQFVSGNYFSVLGTEAVVGRTFLPNEDQPGADPVIVLSYRFWQSHFGSDPGVVGKMLRLNRIYFTILGVAPRDFIGISDPPVVPQVWMPFAVHAQLEPGREPGSVRLVGRLKAGVTWKQARAEMGLIAGQLSVISRDEKSKTVRVNVKSATIFDTDDPAFHVLAAVLLGAVGLVLMIACANVANLMLARSVVRQKEISVRLALGASRARLVRQLLTESTLIALMAGTLGLILSIWTCDLLWWFIDQFIQKHFSFTVLLRVGPDVRIFAYTLFLALLTAIAFGLAPALQGSKANVAAGLKSEASSMGQKMGRSVLRVRDLLVITQVALSLVLLISAGLLLRGLAKAQAFHPDFESKKVLLIEFGLGPPDWQKPNTSSLNRAILEQLRAVSGVKSVSSTLVAMGALSTPVDIEQNQGPNHPRKAFYNVVSPGFFETLGIPILRGRNFSESEAGGASGRTETPVIISETTARHFWPQKSSLGRVFKTGDPPTYARVIGIAKDVRTVNPSQVDSTLLYFLASPNDPVQRVLVRTESDNPRSIVPAIRAALLRVDQRFALAARAWPLDQVLAGRELPSTIGMVVAVILGLLSLLMASMGIYGVMAYSVSRRVHEIGVRIALGAETRDVLRLVLRQGMRLALIGVALGLVLAFTVSHLLVAIPDLGPMLLFGISPRDPVAFAGLSLFLTGVALVATYIPARRATKVDPMVTLRYE